MFLKNALAYSGTNFISQVALFIQGFILRRMLAPEIMGIWNFVGVLRGFVTNITIGLFNGATRELPIFKGKGDEKAQSDCRSVTFIYSLAEVLIAAICLIIYAFFKKTGIPFNQYIAIILTAVLLVFARLQESYVTFFQGAQLYVPLSRLLFVNSLILAVALPIGAALMGLWGIFIGALVAEGLKAVWMIFAARHFGIKPGLKWDFNIFKRLAVYSISLKIADYPFALFIMLDVLWVTNFMSVKSLAIYVMARSFFLQSTEITLRFGTVLMTRTFEQYGKGIEKNKIANDIYRFSQFQLLIVIPLLCWAMFSAVPFLIRQVTPLYILGIYPMSILLMASFFDPRNNNLFTIWIAEKRLYSYGKANIFSLISMSASITVCWFLLGLKTLTGISIGVVVGYMMNFIYIMVTIGREILGREKMIKLLIKVILTAFWTGCVLYYFSHKEVLHNINFLQDIFFSFKKALITLVFILPVVIVGVKTSGTYGKFLNLKNQFLKIR